MSVTAKQITSIIVVLLIAVAAYIYLTMPDNRTWNEKVGDAFHDLDKGPDKAARELENRTPGQRAGDAVKDVGDSIKQSTSRP